MLLIKSLHIVFIISWFAGLFYLPRIFVNHAMVSDAATSERLKLMERKLYKFMTPLGAFAVIFGLWLWFGYGFAGGWLYTKLALTVALVLFHFACGRVVRSFADDRNTRDHVYYRWFNEVPTLIMFASVFLAVLKPY